MKRIWVYYLVSLFSLAAAPSFAQQIYYQNHTRASEILTRWSILYETPWFGSIRNYNRKEAVEFALKLDSTTVLNDHQLDELRNILVDNNLWISEISSESQGEYQFTDSTNTFYRYQTNTNNQQIHNHHLISRKPIFKYFYRTPANLFEINVPSFQLRINPILNLGAGNQLFTNHRGIELMGSIDQKVYFYSTIIESQKKVFEYVSDYITQFKTFPGEGLYKKYNSSLFNVKDGFDYLNAQAYVGLNITKHIGLEFGYGRHFIGQGFRSLFLSDFSNNYLYLKLNTKVWKLHYQNIFAEINPYSANSDPGDILLDKKYFATHYLAFRPHKNVEVGFFETVVFNRENHFEFQYLNPIILYRTIEHGLGSPDNVLIGADVNWKLWNKIRLYSQVLFDEFKLSELISNNRGWWANKIGLQLGARYVNSFGIDNLDLQYEFNQVRPYTYGHRDSVSNYAHYLQPLAHPVGANFKEHLIKATYIPIPKVHLSLVMSSIRKGQDAEGTNWGGNILLPYVTREQDYGNSIGQGILDRIYWSQFEINYKLFHNGYAYAGYQLRTVTSEDKSRNQNESYFSTGIRINMSNRPYIF